MGGRIGGSEELSVGEVVWRQSICEGPSLLGATVFPNMDLPAGPRVCRQKRWGLAGPAPVQPLGDYFVVLSTVCNYFVYFSLSFFFSPISPTRL